MKTLAIALLAISLTGCATVQQNFGKPDDFAKCAAADVVTTAAGIGSGLIHEINPLTKALAIPALGHVGSVVVPVIGLSIAGYYFLKWLDKPQVTAAAAVITCGSAARNVWLMR